MVMLYQVLNFRTMYIMADLSDESAPDAAHQKVLVCIKAYPDGSFDMRPGFNRPGRKYRFEDDRGMRSITASIFQASAWQDAGLCEMMCLFI